MSGRNVSFGRNDYRFGNGKLLRCFSVFKRYTAGTAGVIRNITGGFASRVHSGNVNRIVSGFFAEYKRVCIFTVIYRTAGATVVINRRRLAGSGFFQSFSADFRLIVDVIFLGDHFRISVSRDRHGLVFKRKTACTQVISVITLLRTGGLFCFNQERNVRVFRLLRGDRFVRFLFLTTDERQRANQNKKHNQNNGKSSSFHIVYPP